MKLKSFQPAIRGMCFIATAMLSAAYGNEHQDWHLLFFLLALVSLCASLGWE